MLCLLALACSLSLSVSFCFFRPSFFCCCPGFYTHAPTLSALQVTSTAPVARPHSPCVPHLRRPLAKRNLAPPWARASSAPWRSPQQRRRARPSRPGSGPSWAPLRPRKQKKKRGRRRRRGCLARQTSGGAPAMIFFFFFERGSLPLERRRNGGDDLENGKSKTKEVI